MALCNWKIKFDRKNCLGKIWVLFALFSAFLLSGGAVAQECDVADALLNAHLYNDALTNYTDLLKQNPNLTCAQDGIQDAQRFLTIKSYEIGQAYENASQFNEARVAYIETLKNYPGYIPAQKALEKVSNNKFAAVQTLANLGYYTEAAARLKAVIDENPGTKVPDDLEYLPGRSIFLWGYIRNLIEIWGQTLAEIVIFGLGLYILGWRIGPWIKGSFKTKLDIKPFDEGATGLQLGTGMMAMVEGSLMQIGPECGHEYMHLVAEGFENINKIPADIKGASSEIKWVSNLIEWIFPTNVITLSGYLETSGSCGVGLTLSMVSQTGEILGNITIWQKDYDTTIKPVEPTAVEDKNMTSYYYSLIEPAAIWVFFKLNDLDKIKKKKAAKEPEKFAPLGTDDWKSYAHFHAGVRWELEGNKDKARQQYVMAQNQDMNNYGALINLGYLDIEDKNYNRAIERLSMGIKMAEKSKNYPRERAWFVAMYQLAASYHYKGIRFRKENNLVCANKYIIEAEKECQNLLNKINEEKFLEAIEPNAIIMHASILMDLAYLGEKDESTIKDAENKIKKIESEYSKLAPRVRYNLACYYSIVGDKTKEEKNYKKALENLEYAIEGGGDIIQWAKIDPSMKGVREFNGTKDFADLIQKYSPKEKSDSSDLPLAGLAIIKEAYARQLKEQGIICHYDLILKAESLQEQQTLAKKIGISPKLLRRWALLADLMRIVGNTDYVNLLEAADLGSLEALKKVSDPCEVVNLLNQINQVQSLVKTLPAIEIVNQWIQEAKKIKIEVQ